MKEVLRDYTQMDLICERLNLYPVVYGPGRIQKREGLYTLKGHTAPIDLSACAENEMAILKTAVEQLSGIITLQYYIAI